MKKLLFMLLSAALVTAATAAYSQKPQKNAPPAGPAKRTFNTTYDSLAYALGSSLGQYMNNMNKTMDDQLDPKVTATALLDVMYGRGAWTEEESMEFLQEYFTVRLPREQKKRSDEYMADFRKKNRGFRATESGLLYKIEKQGDMKVKVTDDRDQVVVNYRGSLADGTEFDSNDDITFRVNAVIAGWSEGVKLIGKGGKIRLVIPPDLAYGEMGSGGIIEPYAVLIFDVELLDVIALADQPEEEYYYEDDEDEEYYEYDSGEESEDDDADYEDYG